MDRRTMLLGMGAALAASGLARAEDNPAQVNHMHHHHHAMTKNTPLTEAAADCISKGEVCLDHCLDNLEEGDKTMAACARSVNEMLAICRALQRISAQDAPSLPKMAALAADACKRCEDECRKHEKKHTQCRDCAEACVTCAKACQKYAA